jgi:hypothetical protein
MILIDGKKKSLEIQININGKFLFFFFILLICHINTFSQSNRKLKVQYSQGNYSIVTKRHKKGVIDKKGNLIIPIDYDSLNYSNFEHHYDMPFFDENGFLAVFKDDKWGVIDSLGNEILTCEYENIPITNGKVFLLKKDNKYGAIYLNKEIIIPFIYDHIDYDERNYRGYKNDLGLFGLFTKIHVKKDGKWGMFDVKNKVEILTCSYDERVSSVKDYYLVKKDNKQLILDLKEQIVFIDSNNNNSKIYSTTINGHFKIKCNDKEGFLNLKKGFKGDCKYDNLSVLKGNYMMFEINNKKGFLHVDGREIIEGEYQDFDFGTKSHYFVSERYFYKGLVRASKDNLWGMIDTTGKIVVNFKYKGIEDFKYNKAKVVIDEKVGLIDIKGNEILSCEYDEIVKYTNDFIILKKNDLYGMCNSEGKVILPFKYIHIQKLGNSPIYAHDQNYFYEVSVKGEVLSKNKKETGTIVTEEVK